MVQLLSPSHEIKPVPNPVFLDAETILRREYREGVTLLRRPHLVLFYLGVVIVEGIARLIASHLLLLITVAGLVAARVYLVDSSFEQYLVYESLAEKVFIWVVLGFLSSFGMGFGLHTFVLFLAPAIYHVAAVKEAGSFLDVWGEVWWWSFAWGAGTAIGELPPYFAARQAKLTGQRIEALEEMEGITRNEEASFLGDVKARIIKALDHFGFFHIMLFASVPNPLFDFAGVACGATLKPFWMFFGATFVGKAVFKSSIQTIFVISAHKSADHFAQWLTKFATSINIPINFAVLLANYKQTLNKGGPRISLSMFTEVWSKAEPPGIKDIIVMIVILGFVASLAQSAVQAHLAEKEVARVMAIKNKAVKHDPLVQHHHHHHHHSHQHNE